MRDRAGDIENFDGAAVTTDEIVVVMLLPETIMRRPAVKADPPDNAAFLESLYKAINRRGICVDLEGRTLRNVLQGDGLRCLHEDSQAGLQRRGSTHSRVRALS